MTTKFRQSEFRAFSIALCSLGFILFFYIFIFLIQHQRLEWKYWWAFLPLIIPFINPWGYFLEYIAIDESGMVVIKNAFSRKIIPIKNISTLEYEKRIGYHYLVVKYQDDGKDQQAERDVEFFNTFTLNLLNETIKKINPNIIIKIDDDSKKYQERKKELHLKSPTTIIGWIRFSFVCIFLGFLFAAIILGIPYLINPSIYPHG